MKIIEKFLSDHSIEYIVHKHPAVYTCEEADKYCKYIPGISVKNLLLKGKNMNNFYLLILPADKKLNTKQFSETVQEKRISFATKDQLQEQLNVEPGSVSPLNLIETNKENIELYIDKKVYEANIVSFHPSINTATFELSKKCFTNF